MAMADSDRLRLMLAETIPDDGTDEDTLFTHAEISQFLLDGNNDLERAAFEGWRAKAAKYADLVDVSEGNAARAMSDLHGHAMTMAKYYEKSRPGSTEGRTRVGRVRRGT